MPASLTHFEFFKIYDKDPQSIGYLGTQGPDPFFYYGHGIRSTKKAKELRKYGTFLHTVDPYITFKYLLEYIIGATEKERPVLISFVRGMFAHYILDKNAHPYIWYISSFATEEDNNEAKYFDSHTRIESAIDVLVMDHFKDDTETFNAVNYNINELDIVSKMMFSLGKGCYKNKHIKVNSYRKAIKHMRFTAKALYSKTGKKKAFFDKYLGKTPLSSMSEDKIENIKLDFLNLKHNTWTNCVTNKNPKNIDFYEIFDNAGKEYKKGLILFEAVIDGKEKPSSIDCLFNEIDHNGFKLNAVKKYSNYIYK